MVMKNKLFSLVVMVFCFGNSFAATEILQKTFSIGGWYGSMSGYVWEDFDLTGITLIDQDNPNSYVMNELDPSVNISAEVVECASTYYTCASSSVYRLDWGIQNGKLNYAVWGSGRYNGSLNYYSVSMTVKIMISYTVNTFSPFDKSINVELPETQWADIHYTINGGAPLNVRMDKNNDIYKHKIFVPIKNSDVVEYWYTYMGNDGIPVNTSTATVEVSGLVDLLATELWNTQFHLVSQEQLDWVIIHYSIDHAAYNNYSMDYSGTYQYPDHTTYRYDHYIPGINYLPSGTQLVYFYTYSLNGVAQDSEVKIIDIP